MLSFRTRLGAWMPTENGKYIIEVNVHGSQSAFYTVAKRSDPDGEKVLAEISKMLSKGIISQQEALELNNATIALQGLYRQNTISDSSGTF